jgi:predicted MFS family arabinose efflux permease
MGIAWSSKAKGAFVEEAWTILVLALAPAVGLGIGRFSYALVLPDMQTSLGWSYAQAGWMNTLNAAGYLLGAVTAARAVARFTGFGALVGGTVACVLGLMLSALSADFVLLGAARLLAGIGGALAFVAGGTLAAGLSARQPDRAVFLLGLYYTGPGIGIVLSGAVTPLLIGSMGPGSWWIAWGALAALAGALSLPLYAARGAETGESSGPGARRPLDLVALWPLLLGYCAFGAGYIAYMTFMVAWMRDVGAGAGEQALFWVLIGSATIASPWLWSRITGGLRAGLAPALLTGVTLVGALIPLLIGGAWAAFASALIFGAAFFAVVAAVTGFVRRNLPKPSWASCLGTLTVSFGIGQTFGPVGIGWVMDRAGGLSAGLWISACFLLVAMLLMALQNDLERPGGVP